MSSQEQAILLVNLGSPASPSTGDVRRYLNEFLMDGHVLDLPYPLRRLLVSGAILPFRPRATARAYASIWWPEGSPLLVIGERVRRLVQEELRRPVKLAMRYGQPSIESVLREIIMGSDSELRELIVAPLYPHYAQSSTKTAVEAVESILARLAPRVQMRTMSPFYEHPRYIDALCTTMAEAMKWDYDHVLFSYHGLPERHLRKADPTGRHCLSRGGNCCFIDSPAHQTCYRHQVFRTTELVVEHFQIPEDRLTIAFQSRLKGDAWLRPFTDFEVERLARDGVKRLVVVCPAFVADCLETLEEIGMRAKSAFVAAGGQELRLVRCLNDHPRWIAALAEMLSETLMHVA